MLTIPKKGRIGWVEVDCYCNYSCEDPLYFFSKSMCIIVGDWGMFVKKEITAGNTGTDGDKKQNGREKRENYL